MAHAAPTAGLPARITVPRTPDVFSEHTHRIARWVWPIALGLVYGYWAAANRRGGEAITGWNILFGFVTTVVFILLCIGVRALAPRMMRELHALLWTAFVGIAFGFLYSQTGTSVLRSTGLALAVAGVFFVLAFYRYYTHEDAEGHRIR